MRVKDRPILQELRLGGVPVPAPMPLLRRPVVDVGPVAARERQDVERVPFAVVTPPDGVLDPDGVVERLDQPVHRGGADLDGGVALHPVGFGVPMFRASEPRDPRSEPRERIGRGDPGLEEAFRPRRQRERRQARVVPGFPGLVAEEVHLAARHDHRHPRIGGRRPLGDLGPAPRRAVQGLRDPHRGRGRIERHEKAVQLPTHRRPRRERRRQGVGRQIEDVAQPPGGDHELPAAVPIGVEGRGIPVVREGPAARRHPGRVNLVELAATDGPEPPIVGEGPAARRLRQRGEGR